MEELTKRISEFVRETRKSKELSVSDVLDRCILSRSYINMIESGKNSKTNRPIMPTLEAIEELSKGLGVSTYDFLTSVHYIDSREDNPLLNYKLTIEELLTYSFGQEDIDFDSLNYEQRQQLVDMVNDFIEFQIHLYKKRHLK